MSKPAANSNYSHSDQHHARTLHLTPPSSAEQQQQQQQAMSTDKSNNNKSSQDPYCSVLNIVVDHIMISPTPMEPDEFRQVTRNNTDNSAMNSSSSSSSSNNLQVPVLRVFGPILRHHPSTRSDSSLSMQSACLYVHGAFPYLLARPVVAGPDGSLLGSVMSASSSNTTSSSSSGAVDWDNVASVQRILPMLQIHLEAALQQHSSSAWKDHRDEFTTTTSGSATNTSTKKHIPPPQVQMIRRITVVVGRGFYTYCPGPPAPFLRVEYYNPKLRWKVKLILERGIPDLPRSYHPDPQQYYGHDHDASHNHNDKDKDDDEALLRFHCYEAHIPYSVQFFKDYNLAGMSYLHLAKEGVKFRHALPRRVQHRWDATTKNDTTTQHPQQDTVDTKSLCYFLESNVETRNMWELSPLARKDRAEREEPQPTTTSSTTTNVPQAPPCSWESSHTSDSHLASLQQSSESSQLPPSQGSTDSRPYSPPALFKKTAAISWNLDAVPPAPEQPAQHGFQAAQHDYADLAHNSSTTDWFWTKKETSCDVELDVSVQHILNVHEVMTSLPDNQQEREQIHWRAVPSLREIWRQERRRMAKLLPPKQDFLSGSSSSADEEKEKQQQEDDASKPPSFTLNVKRGASIPGVKLAQAGMKRLVDVTTGLQEDYRRVMQDIIRRHQHHISHVNHMLLEAVGKRASKLQFPVKDAMTTPSETSKRQTASPLFTPPMDEAIDALGALAAQFDDDQENDETDQASSFQQSQLLGDDEYWSSPVVASPFQALSQTYYSQDSSSDNNLCAAVRDPFEQSQRVERGDCVVDGPFENVEDFIDPETLAPFCDPEEADVEDDYAYGDNDEDGMDEKAFESTLSILATQTLGYDEPSRDVMSQANDCSQPDETLLSYASGAAEDSTSDSDTDESVMPIDSFVKEGGDGNTDLALFEDSVNSLTNCTTPAGATQWTWPEDGFSIEPSASPPYGDECNLVGGSLRSHPLNLGKGMVPWLLHSKQYHQTRKKLFDRNIPTRSWLPPIPSGGINIEPLRGAPCTDEVASWMRQKLRKRLRSDKTGESESTHKKARGNDGKGLASGLRFDENSRMLTTMAPMEEEKTFRGEMELGSFKEVEEVEWKCSQPIDMTLTQSSQPEPFEQMFQEEPQDELCKLEGAKGSGSNAQSQSTNTCTPESDSQSKVNHTGTESESPGSFQPLGGIGNQGGRIQIEGGGGLKAKTRATQPGANPLEETKPTAKDAEQLAFEHPTPLTVLSIEIHVQCRTGRAGVHDSKEIAMTPNSQRDKIFSVAYAYGFDPGGGDALQMKEFGCLFVPVETENAQHANISTIPVSEPPINKAHRILSSMPRGIMGVSSQFVVESVRDERQLLLRLASIVRRKDPDMLVSWDTQGSGLGYLIERGVAMGKGNTSGLSSEKGTGATEIDMARLLSRIPTATKPDHSSTAANSLLNHEKNRGKPTSEKTPEKPSNETKEDQKWSGSGLGGDWDDRVGPGAAAASIVGRLVFAGWKIVAEEVKHANASYLQAMAATILNKRIPYHDNLTLTRWYSADQGRERWRTLNYKLTQATATLLLIDALDIIGRAGEAARLSGVEFSQSFPGIRGSQYKVEGVLLRALQSLHSDERGQKKGRNNTSLPADLQGIAIDGGSSLSTESKSQTQSPWKMRRKLAVTESANARFGEDESEDFSLHDLAGRNYFFFSPSLTDANKQEALEVQALTLEPQSGHQIDPVVVCDFTALYPSLVIAYNLCYSTCFGKLDYLSTRREMRQQGRTTGKVGPIIYPESRTATVLLHHMKSLEESTGTVDDNPPKDRAYAAPNGTLFVSEAVLKGVLPQVLDEILSTRAMLKKAAKEYQRSVPNLSPSILRQLEARQLALKYVANVTYGYTSATFSGRCAMPVLADTIVECGRRTLTNAINLANQWGRDKNGKWHGCQVIYGDTDSVFVRLPGRSVQEGFTFGEEFCKAVTASNPPPVQLKLEKVYHGSIMQTKKKYCGMKYESKDQAKPIFEAKGIETVRRDQCALTQKILRNALVTLFQQRGDLTQVKSYLERQWSLILAGRLPVADFILTGRVRSRYRGGRVGPVQAVLARRLTEADPGRVVRHKERLPYVIVATPGRNFRLRDCVLTPMELLEQWDAYTIHSVYYITKHVNAALQRCLGLEPHFVNVQSWYDACPKPRRRLHVWPMTRAGSSLMISSYFGSDLCSLCGQRCKTQGNTRATVCASCRAHPVHATTVAWSQWHQAQQAAHQVAQRCRQCNLCFEDATTFATLKPSLVKKKQKFANDATTTSGGSLTAASWTAASRSNNPGIVVPLANCSCIDCPTTFERHRLREAELQAEAICQALDLF